VLFIGTQFSILYTSMYSPAEAATLEAEVQQKAFERLFTHTPCSVCVCVCVRERVCLFAVGADAYSSVTLTKAHWRRRLRAEATSSDEKSTYGRTFIMRFGIGLLQNGQAAVDLNSVLPSCPSFLLLLLLLRRFPASAAVRHTGLSLVRSQRSFWCCLNLSP